MDNYDSVHRTTILKCLIVVLYAAVNKDFHINCLKGVEVTSRCSPRREGERGVRTPAHERGEGTLSALELAQRNDELGLDRAWPGWGSKLRRFLLVESVKPRSQHAWCGVL